MRLGMDTHIGLGSTLSFIAGGYGVYIDGEEKAVGPLDYVSDFDTNDNVYGYLGLEIKLDPSSYVGVKVESGYEQGGQLYFARRF